MLVDAEPVEAHLIGKLELIEIIVVEPMTDLRVVQVARDIHPDAMVFAGKILRQKPVGHQMEPCKLHALVSPNAIASASRERLKPITDKELAEVAKGAGQRPAQVTARRLASGEGNQDWSSRIWPGCGPATIPARSSI